VGKGVKRGEGRGGRRGKGENEKKGGEEGKKTIRRNKLAEEEETVE